MILKNKFTIIILIHNMKQAERISDRTIFMAAGKVIEAENTKQFFTKPSTQQAEDYLKTNDGHH